jgi:DNA-binding CsgD family transcriptional regulator
MGRTMCDELEELCDVIGRIYDAALDPCLWDSVIERIAYFVGGVGGGFYSKDIDAGIASPRDFGYERLRSAALLKEIRPFAETHVLGDLEQAIATTDLMTFGELARTGRNRQRAQQQGVIDFVSIGLDRTATRVVLFGVFRHERNGVVDERARRHMRLIAPHIRRAILIGTMCEFKAAEAAMLADTLDEISAGMYLVDAERRLIHANAAGSALLEARDILSSMDGRLVASDAQVDQTFQDVFAAAGQSDAAPSTKGIAVPLIGRNGQRYVARALPLPPGAQRRAGTAHTAVTVVFIRKVALGASFPEVIRKTFKLTPTELRVLLAIVEVGGIPEVAASLGVADTTVRTHVTHLFVKTGTARQADLAKLVAGYSTPLVD